jgi:hypothetical protein
MPWVHFMHNFDWHPPERNGRVVLFFPKGTTIFVRRLCAEAAVRKEKGRVVERPENAVRHHVSRRA